MRQVVLVRLHTEHNRLSSRMHWKLQLASSLTCPCGQEDQTTEHVLQRCPLHKATRDDVWPVRTPLTTKLYGCKQELDKTASFISLGEANWHLKRTGIMDSALCDCKEAEQTVHHILQDCPIWRKQRHQLWSQDESTTDKLWETAEDLCRTTQFLATCGLRV